MMSSRAAGCPASKESRVTADGLFVVVWLANLVLTFVAFQGIKHTEPEIWERIGKPSFITTNKQGYMFVKFVWSGAVSQISSAALRCCVYVLRPALVLGIVTLINAGTGGSLLSAFTEDSQPTQRTR
jgi:hypothetical protein